MNKTVWLILLATIAICMSCNKTKFDPGKFETYPVYNGNDLGVTWSPEKTRFKIWAPTAAKVEVRIFDAGIGGNELSKLELKPANDGVWSGELKGDFLNKFYSFQVKVNGKWLNQVPGPDAIGVGVNGMRGQVVDLKATNPQGWDNDTRPELKSFNDIILYETHIRDFSVHPKADFKYKGKFLAFTETGVKLPNGQAIGIDHLKEMGITHIHLLPSFDFRSIDESQPAQTRYNWGYDPQNYNVPDGSFATNATDANIRIKEFKQMVQALHQNGIRVVMDVVYNHVGDLNTQSFEQVVPGYYFRHNADGR
jgi:pullulanase